MDYTAHTNIIPDEIKSDISSFNEEEVTNVC